MESLHLRDHFLELARRREEGCAEVEGIRVRLSEARARHDDEAGGIQELERVELIGRHARGARGGNRLDGQLDPRE